MWYVIQIGVAIYLAYAWTTLPGNTPADFGRGLFLGGLVAWSVTALITVIRDRYVQLKTRKREKLVKEDPKLLPRSRTLIDRRRK